MARSRPATPPRPSVLLGYERPATPSGRSSNADADGRMARWRRASMVLFGLSLTQTLPLVAWAAGTAFGAAAAAAWTMCAATQVFVYYSRDRMLLAAGMTPIAVSAIVGPLLAFGVAWESVAISAFMLLALAAGASFVARSDALIAKAAEEAAARRSAARRPRRV